MSIGRLHVITDTVLQSRFSHEELATMACGGGADVIQLRDKHLDDNRFTVVAERVREICRISNVQFVVNDRVAIARRVGAFGVHLGRGDAPLADVSGLVVGASAGDVERARAAEKAGANYIGFGHVYATSSKHKPGPPVGIGALACACAAVDIPVIAIGGITASTVAEVMGSSGAWGVAVVAAVCAAADPRDATARLSDAVAAYR